MLSVTDTDLDGGRRVELRRPTNMRELGGLPSREGHALRRGVLFRAGGLHQLERDDIASVRGLGLRTLVDLRTRNELVRHGEPSEQLAPRRLHFPMIPDIWDLRALGDGEPLESYFVERYEEMLELGAEAIARTLRLLGEPDSYPLGFFCAAGKDRTGVMTAVVLRLLDVNDEVIVADYVLSGPELDRLIALVGDQERWTTERMAGGVPRLLTAPAAVMRTFLAGLAPADELAARFGLGGPEVARMRELLLVPAEAS
jgi:protein-tyrosine phosphatase